MIGNSVTLKGIVLALVLFVLASACAADVVETVPDEVPLEAASEGPGELEYEKKYVPGAGDEKRTLREDRSFRDLDEEYETGELTRTEYIQRKREIESSEE